MPDDVGGDGGAARQSADPSADIEALLGYGFRSMCRLLKQVDADDIEPAFLEALANVAKSKATGDGAPSVRDKIAASRAGLSAIAERMRLALEARKQVDKPLPEAATGETIIHIHPPVTGADKAELEAKRAQLERDAEGE